MTSGLRHSAVLEVNITGFWSCATGFGGGELDATVAKDRFGLPFIGGRHLKGLIREAAVRLSRWDAGSITQSEIALMFGANPEKERRPTASFLAFSNARLPQAVYQLSAEIPTIAAGLTRRVASTRIDEVTGAASPLSLRSVEVAIPLVLFSSIAWCPAGRLDDALGSDRRALDSLLETWPQKIAQCLPFIHSVGAFRNRGYGRALLQLAAL